MTTTNKVMVADPFATITALRIAANLTVVVVAAAAVAAAVAVSARLIVADYEVISLVM